MKSFLLGVCILTVTACSGSNSPAAPSAPTTAPLHVAVDVSTCYLIGNTAISIDGTVVGTVVPGSAGVTQQVVIGSHTVSGIGVTTNLQFQTTWVPTSVSVPAAGLNDTLYCTANRGYSETRIGAP